MTAVNGVRTDLIQVLTRADKRWADRRADEPAPADYLKHLEQYLRPLLEVDEASNGDVQPSVPDADVANLRAQHARLRADVERLLQANQELTKELGRLRTDYADSVRGSGLMADQVEQLRRERDQLVDQLRAKAAHVCAWPWPDPSEPPGPCECGRPYPRLAVEDAEEVVPDVDPWDEVFGRLRVELAGWGHGQAAG